MRPSTRPNQYTSHPRSTPPHGSVLTYTVCISRDLPSGGEGVARPGTPPARVPSRRVASDVSSRRGPPIWRMLWLPFRAPLATIFPVSSGEDRARMGINMQPGRGGTSRPPRSRLSCILRHNSSGAYYYLEVILSMYYHSNRDLAQPLIGLCK